MFIKNNIVQLKSKFGKQTVRDFGKMLVLGLGRTVSLDEGLSVIVRLSNGERTWFPMENLELTNKGTIVLNTRRMY